MKELSESFSSANVFPAKILKHEKLWFSCLHEGKVFPIHLQLNPTNRCNFNCGFCSCSGRDKEHQLSAEEIYNIMWVAKCMGCESVTITGGGEPLLYPDFDVLFGVMADSKIQVGLVTNGVMLHRVNGYSDPIVWCRISSSDALPAQLKAVKKTTSEWFKEIRLVVEENSHVDWAFSHVLTEKPNKEFLKQLVQFANENNFTHIRIVNDIFNSGISPNVEWLKSWFCSQNIDTSKVIYQTRSHWTNGQDPCYISLLKPVVGADGYVYPCCGTQYALANPSRDYERTMRMGKAVDLDELVMKQLFFDGSNCVKCYYSNYNWALGVLLSNLKHEKFV